jgi:hypothetical protein
MYPHRHSLFRYYVNRLLIDSGVNHSQSSNIFLRQHSNIVVLGFHEETKAMTLSVNFITWVGGTNLPIEQLPYSSVTVDSNTWQVIQKNVRNNQNY